MARRRFRRRTSRDAYRRMNLRCPYCGRENFLTSKGLREHKGSCKAVPKSGRRHSHPVRFERHKEWAEREWQSRRAKSLPKKAEGRFEAWRSGPKKAKKAKRKARKKVSGPRVYVSRAATRAERMGISLNEYKRRRQKRGKSKGGWKKPSRKDRREHARRQGPRRPWHGEYHPIRYS